MKKIKASIVGITGYAGEELLKILLRHDGVAIAGLFGRSSTEVKPLKEVYPHFKNLDLQVESLNEKTLAERSDVVFLALPHKVSFGLVPALMKSGKKIIDLSADFRLKSHEIYEQWYGAGHDAKEYLPHSVYGLPEIYRDKIKKAQLVANPGCYPTTVLLGLYPAIKNGLLEIDSIIIDSKSGISGAGRKSVEEYFANEHPNFRPYNIAGAHRHIPEIEQELALAAGKQIRVTFTPQIIPVERGMLSTIYANLAKKAVSEEVTALYKEFYKNEPFIKVFDTGKLPDVRGVANTNFCCLAVKIDERTGRIVIVSAIDNLLKGASGQAVQNMNIMFGFDEKTGLI